MSSFFESSGASGSEMEFIAKRLEGVVLGMDSDGEPSSSEVLGEILNLVSKDKVTPRDAALMAFVVGGIYSLERLNQRQAHFTGRVMADLRGESFP